MQTTETFIDLNSEASSRFLRLTRSHGVGVEVNLTLHTESKRMKEKLLTIMLRFRGIILKLQILTAQAHLSDFCRVLSKLRME